MEQSGGLCELSIQQDLCPAPNEGPGAMDWLPQFAGFSWLAYGAHFSVVITMAPNPSNTREAAMGGFCHQVLSSDSAKEGTRVKERVSRVGWSPAGPSLGSLAAAAGNLIYLYGPKGLNSASNGNQKMPEIPLTWVNTEVLEHFSDVLSFSWSESGDGLLSVGPEIVMWEKIENSWHCLWRSRLEQPHSLSSASWSARGIAATAERAVECVKDKEINDADHLVKVWWWEEGKELLEVELSHPQELLSIQWRPMRGYGASDQSFRPVLLTCCGDGVVRLWAEIGTLGFPDSRSSSFADMDPAPFVDQLSTQQGSQFKLAFFVSAVIDVNSVLKGVLGNDIHVTWPEARGGLLKRSSNSTGEDSSIVKKEGELSPSEWLIGIGPTGSVALWSVQSLDDLSPARGPLVQLLHQRSGLLPPISNLECNVDNIQGHRKLQAVKVVVHRSHGTSSGPPSSIDVFETWSPYLLRWSSIWPPAAAIGGPSSKAMASNSGANSLASGGKLNAWGISSEIMYLGGHKGAISQIAVHPIASTRLVASLDDQGMVLLWDSNGSSLNPRLEINSFFNPLWKLSGQLSGHQVNRSSSFASMAWAPVIVEQNDAVLLLGHSSGVDCYLISRKVSLSKGKPKSMSFSHNYLYTLPWPSINIEDGLQGIYCVPHRASMGGDLYRTCCIAVGVGTSGLKLVSWMLNFKVGLNRESSRPDSQDLEASAPLNDTVGTTTLVSVVLGTNLVDTYSVASLGSNETVENDKQSLVLEGRLIGLLSLGIEEQVTSIAVTTSKELSCRYLDSRNGHSEICEVITGCADGALRLWKTGDFEISEDSFDKSVGWQCVGLVKSYMGPVTKVAFCSGGFKIASTGLTQGESNEAVHIWGLDTLKDEWGFCLEAEVPLQSPAVSVSWLDGGNGLFILGVATMNGVKLFAQCRSSALWTSAQSGLSDGNIWTCLASYSLTSFECNKSLSWETQGSLVVSCGGHILLYSNYVLILASGSDVKLATGTKSLDKFKDLIVGNSQMLNSQGLQSSRLRPPTENEIDVQSGVRLDKFHILDQDKEFCTIAEAAEKIGCPLLDYHPTSLLCWISGGYRHCARASIRHLASSLNPTSQKVLNSKVSRTPLTEIFQERDQLKLGSGQSTAASFGSQGPRYLSSSRMESSSMSLGYDYRAGEQSGSTKASVVVKKGGFEVFDREEVNDISNLLRDTVKIPGLEPDEKLQLLAVVDVMADMDGLRQHGQIDGLDMPGQRFWLAVRFSSCYAHWVKQTSSDVKELGIDSKAIAWALQSEFKETLLDLCLHDQTPSWPAMRALGVGYWFIDGANLRNQMEKVARAQYLVKKDPKSCALLYLALDRCSVLAGLFRLSRDQSDKPLADFLLRNFKDEKNQAAALKNAYVLMGKHRHELAAAFFILGGDGNSAAVVCAKNLGDVQLALVISSLLEGTNGPIARNIIFKYAMPMAQKTGDGWLASVLQWLLGNGIESLQELGVQSRDVSTLCQERLNEDFQGLNPSSFVFPFDNEIGSYCLLLTSKPRLRTGTAAARASTLVRIATVASASALKRSGLSLQALEFLKIAHPANLDKVQFELVFDGSSSSPSTSISRHHGPFTNVTGKEVGFGWISSDLVVGIQRRISSSLALQTASQRLKDHPHWSKTRWVSGPISYQINNLDKAGNLIEQKKGRPENAGSESFSEQADLIYENDVKLLERKYMVNIKEVTASLGTFAHIHHCHYLFHRLVQGLRSFSESSEIGIHLAKRSAVSVTSAQNLEAIGAEVPWVLARAVLACGGGAAALKSSNLEGLNRQLKNVLIENSGHDEALQGFQIEELIRFGGEIQLLANAAIEDNSNVDKERDLRAKTLLSFIVFVAAAWLGRKTKTLFALIAPTILDPSLVPKLPAEDLDAVTWFEELELAQNPRTGKKPVEATTFNSAGRVTIPRDDAWRVLGVTLWTHVLIYVRKQLTGISSELTFNSFGRSTQGPMKTSGTSLVQPPIPSGTKASNFFGFNIQSSALSSTWMDFKSKVRDGQQLQHYTAVPSDGGELVHGGSKVGKLSLTDGSDNDHFGAALLSSLTSIVAGLRKQLATHLKYSLNKSDADSLALWLWGKPPLTSVGKPATINNNASNFLGASSSNAQVGISGGKNANTHAQPGPSIFPAADFGIEDKAWKELWQLLVVRDKVCSALGLEGLNGQKFDQADEKENLSGWYVGRQGKLDATPVGLTGSVRFVTAIGKHPTKRIMWNAVKGGPSLLDDDSSRRLEEDQSGSRLSKDGLHLSEEFTEWVDLRGHFR